jgi:hypothetical protein
MGSIYDEDGDTGVRYVRALDGETPAEHRDGH